MLDACLQAAEEANETHRHGGSVLERIFLYCATWSLGRHAADGGPPKFKKAVAELGTSNVPTRLDSRTTETFFEYFVSDDTTDWAHWVVRVPAWEYVPTTRRNRNSRGSSSQP